MPQAPPTATARANANIALVKYWGKRNERLRLPQNGSLSLTLDGLGCETTVEVDPALAGDRLVLDGAPRAGREVERITALLDLIRARAGASAFARVRSESRVPVAAGLASSAAGFAALAVAGAAAYGLDLPARELSILARRGSGSACRSIYGGFVEWRRGERPDGEDSYAEQVLAEGEWAVGMAIAVVDAGPKDVGSTEGMERSTDAPGYRHWLATVEADLAAARRAVRARDLATLGLIAESNATKMHLAAAGARPPVVYWTEATAAIVAAVARWREEGLEGFFTVDAGPNVAVLAREADLERIAARLAACAGVTRTIVCRPGAGATLVATA
jgi:diphosphomevalonate decarboxylase